MVPVVIMSREIVGVWTARVVMAPERNKAPVATPIARRTVAAETAIRIFIFDPPMGDSLPIVTNPVASA